MFGQGKGFNILTNASGSQEPFVKEPPVHNKIDFLENFNNAQPGRLLPPVKKGLRAMHASTHSFEPEDWKEERTTYDKEFRKVHPSDLANRPSTFSYPDEIKTLGFDNQYHFDPHYSEHFCQNIPRKTSSDLLVTRLGIGAKQMDSVGVKDVLRRQTPVYSTQYGRTHAYLGMLKTVESPPQPVVEKTYGSKRVSTFDPITGDKMREDNMPSRGFRKASVSKLLNGENNKFRNIRSIISDGIL